MRHTRRRSTIATRQSRRRRVDGNIYLVLLEAPGGNIEITEVLIGKLAGIFCDAEMQGLWKGLDRLEGAMLDFDSFTQ
jgi:hypothetical protein